jgi:hypothetical protein
LPDVLHTACRPLLIPGWLPARTNMREAGESFLRSVTTLFFVPSQVPNFSARAPTKIGTRRLSTPRLPASGERPPRPGRKKTSRRVGGPGAISAPGSFMRLAQGLGEQGPRENGSSAGTRWGRPFRSKCTGGGPMHLLQRPGFQAVPNSFHRARHRRKARLSRRAIASILQVMQCLTLWGGEAPCLCTK